MCTITSLICLPAVLALLHRTPAGEPELGPELEPELEPTT